MDRIWQWAWDRYGARYSWALYAISVPFSLPVYLFWALLIVAVENSGDYMDAAAVTVVAVPVLGYVVQLPGLGPVRVVEQWASGHEVDRRGHWRPRTPGRGERLPERRRPSWCPSWLRLVGM